jgi:hypothetical protein
MDDYVEKITERLNSAFELAIKQQYAAAVGNERRAPARSIPTFKPKDLLYVWARSAREQFIQNEGGKKVALPKKWVNPWVGPFEKNDKVARQSLLCAELQREREGFLCGQTIEAPAVG